MKPYGKYKRMMERQHATPSQENLQAQRGVALFAVMVIVLLSMLLALWASRSALFNEMIVGNDADYQRAYEAAQAMLQDAEIDLRYSSYAGGVRCTSVPGYPPATRMCDLGHSILSLPERGERIVPLLSLLENLPGNPKCRDALCRMREKSLDPDFWSDETTFNQWKAVGARYGQYSGAAQVSSGASDAINPILRNRAWYWVEVGKFKKVDGGDNAELPSLCIDPPLVYRITAIAEGLKPGTRVVLQEVYFNQCRQD